MNVDSLGAWDKEEWELDGLDNMFAKIRLFNEVADRVCADDPSLRACREALGPPIVAGMLALFEADEHPTSASALRAIEQCRRTGVTFSLFDDSDQAGDD